MKFIYLNLLTRAINNVVKTYSIKLIVNNLNDFQLFPHVLYYSILYTVYLRVRYL